MLEIKKIPISKIIGSLCKMRLEKDYEKNEIQAQKIGADRRVQLQQAFSEPVTPCS